MLKNGRAQFFASVKRIGNFYISTKLFNLLALLLMCFVFYLTLQFSLLKRMLDLFGGRRRRRDTASAVNVPNQA